MNGIKIIIKDASEKGKTACVCYGDAPNIGCIDYTNDAWHEICDIINITSPFSAKIVPLGISQHMHIRWDGLRYD